MTRSTNATTETKSTGAMTGTKSETDVFDDILTQLKPRRYVEIPMMINKEIEIRIQIHKPLNAGEDITLRIYRQNDSEHDTKFFSSFLRRACTMEEIREYMVELFAGGMPMYHRGYLCSRTDALLSRRLYEWCKTQSDTEIETCAVCSTITYGYKTVCGHDVCPDCLDKTITWVADREDEDEDEDEDYPGFLICPICRHKDDDIIDPW
jgi:hypothetical protein